MISNFQKKEREFIFFLKYFFGEKQINEIIAKININVTKLQT